MPAPYMYSYGGSRMRRSYPFGMLGRGRGRGCAHRRWL